MRYVFPRAFQRVKVREAASGKTIHRAADVETRADRGSPYSAALVHPDELSQAEYEHWRLPIVMNPWRLPAGAFGDPAGPP